MDFSIIVDNTYINGFLATLELFFLTPIYGLVNFIIDNHAIYFDGFLVTLKLVFFSLIYGGIIAVPLAILLATSKNKFILFPINAFVYFFRGTPLLIQMFLIYYGAGQFDALKESFLWDYFKDAHFCALFAFALNTGAYTAEIFRGAIANTPLGEIEAAKACGMSKGLMIRRIILPSAFRRSLSAYGNEMIFMLHGTALASVITIVDITGAARIVNSRLYSPFEAFITAGACYMIITFTMVWVLKKVEYKWMAHLRVKNQ